MVSRIKVFPTKTHGWVTLARKPMIADNSELEKIFRSYSEVCLLNLPSARKKVARTPKSNSKGKLHEEKLAFSERDRELFLEICGVKKLSECVTTEPQTENYRPCPDMQNLVRDIIPYIQRFIYHHEEHRETYEDLKESGIAQEIKSLSFGQVGKLYIYYRLEQSDENTIVESEDLICLLKDKKELYIQKDHLSAKIPICRELVKLFTTEKSFGDELKQFLDELVFRYNDMDSLKNLLERKHIKELPQDEERWEVPEAKNIFPISSSRTETVLEVEMNMEEKGEEDEEEEDKLHCWPPKASINKTGGRSTGKPSQAVEAVMKMWPPPAPPTSSTPLVSHATPVSCMRAQENTTELQLHREPDTLNIKGIQGPRSSGSIPLAEEFMPPHAEEEMPLKRVFQQDNDPKHKHKREASWFQTNKIDVMERPTRPPGLNLIGNMRGDIKNAVSETKPRNPEELEPNPPVLENLLTERTPKAAVPGLQGVDPNVDPRAGSSAAHSERAEASVDKSERSSSSSSSSSTTPSTAGEQQPAQQPSEQVQNSVLPPEVSATQFQGSATHRPPIPLDNAIWTRPTVAELVLEDLTLDFSLPDFLQVSNGKEDNDAIGRWGEQLVYSFLHSWRESGEGPREITWCNENGESGHPYDFKLIVPSSLNSTREVFVEVKTTVKQEKHFIHLSANELDFALKEKERYHIYRVYGAGDPKHTRVCRIKNLAQHLHSKTLELFLFV